MISVLPETLSALAFLRGLPVAQLPQLRTQFGSALLLLFMVGFEGKAFVNAALREKDRQARRQFTRAMDTLEGDRVESPRAATAAKAVKVAA